MPEALAVLVVFAVCIGAYVAAWLRSRDPSLVDVSEDRERLCHHETWLRERLLRAVNERWDAEMIASISDELHVTSMKLSRVVVSSAGR